MPINPKQQRFVDEYLIDLNATRAAREAGYAFPDRQGPRLLGFVGVAEAIRKAQEKRAAKVEVTQEYVLRTIIDTIELCQQEGVSKAGDILRGSELLGRHLAMFTDKLETKDATVDREPPKQSDDEWAKAHSVEAATRPPARPN